MTQRTGTDSATALRKQLLANGYTPIPNLDKRCFWKGWADTVVDEKLIDSWARMRRFDATGIRVENRLAVIDFDIDHPVMQRIGDLVDRMIEDWGGDTALVRHGKGWKEAWYVRTAEVFSRLHSRRFVVAGSSADDGTHSIEIFGGASARQFGSFGAHTKADDGSVVIAYEWDGDESPATVPLAELPVLTKDQFWQIVDLVERELEAAGMTRIIKSERGESDAVRVYDLLEDMIFDLADGRQLTLPELREAAGKEEGLRCSASWLEGPTARRTDRCIVGLTRHGQLVIWESASGQTHMEASLAPKDWNETIDRLAEKLKELDIKSRNKLHPRDGADVAAAKLRETYAYCATRREDVVPLWATTLDAGMTLARFRMKLLPWAEEVVGPRGGVSKINPVDIWMGNDKRVTVEGLRLRPDMPRPVYEEDGAFWVNIYAPPILDAEGGDARLGIEFIEQLVPDPEDRKWFRQWLAHKFLYPHIPGPAVIMMARSFGTGRGTFAVLLAKLFGANYVKTVPFHIFAGKSYQSQYNDWAAEALIAVVNESSESQTTSVYADKRNTYEHLKELVEPRPIQRMYVVKGTGSFVAPSFTSYLIFTNHTDALPIPENDRRFGVLENGEPRDQAYWERLNRWMDDDRNVAAFALWLAETDLSDYSPFVAPPMTTAKAQMSEESKSDIDRAIEIALANLPSSVFVPEQLFDLMRQAREVYGFDYPDKWTSVARRLLRSTAHRVGVLHGRNWMPSINGKRFPAYATTKQARIFWTAAEPDDLKGAIMRNGSPAGSGLPGNVLVALFREPVSLSDTEKGKA